LNPQKIPHYRKKPARTTTWKIDPEFTNYFDKEYVDTDDLKAAFVWPSRDDPSIYESLKYHLGMHKEVLEHTKPPTKEEFDFVMNNMETIYAKPIKHLPKRYLSRRLFIDILRKVDMNSSPGFPWKETYKTNKDFLMLDDETLNMQNVEELYLAVEARLKDLETRPVADDINIFIKDELHKRTKEQVGAWRMISSVGITDCVVDRLLFGDYFDLLYTPEGYTSTPNKAGWTPYKGGFRYLARRMKLTSEKQLMADKKCWDWTMQMWIVRLLIELMIRFCGFSDPLRETIIRNRLYALFYYPVFAVGPNRFSLGVGGIMKSGCLGTIIWNGMAQVGLHILACFRMSLDPFESMPEVIGDDTLQALMENVERYRSELERAGCICREYSIVSLANDEKVEFAGHEFDLNECLPSYRMKHLASLYTQSEFKLEQLESYLRLYAFDPEMYARILPWVADKGGTCLSRSYLVDWYKGYVE